jgi:methionine synthase II (cobalamin-independent)
VSQGIELDNHVMGDHPGATFAFHLCRGNQGSRWLVSGSYEPLARQIFERIRTERLMLEYYDERSGGFQPLAYVLEDKIAVLSLVTTKSPRQEISEWLEVRLQEASDFVPLQRLALSPQCGFATSVIDNAITVEDEKRKLRTTVETTQQVSGASGPPKEGHLPLAPDVSQHAPVPGGKLPKRIDLGSAFWV